jgi:hypothetical protein
MMIREARGFMPLGQSFPDDVATGAALGDPFAVGWREVQVGEQQREQEKIRDDDHTHAEAGGDRELVDGGDLDDQHREKTHGIGQQCDRTGHDEEREGAAGGGRAIVTVEDLVAKRADLLDAVADADGEDQKRDQDGEGIDSVAERGERTELPDHGHERAKDRSGGEFPAAGVVPDQQGGHRDGDREQRQDTAGALADVADDLGEADDVDGDPAGAGGFHALPDGLQFRGNVNVIEFLSGLRIDLEQLGADNGAGEVVRHQLAEPAGLDDVFADLREAGRGRGEICGHDVAAREAILDDLDITHVGGEQRLDLGAIHPGEERGLIRDLFQLGEKLRREDVAFAHDEGDEHAVRAAELALVFGEGLDVGMIGRQRLVETRVHAQVGGMPGHDCRQRREPADERQALAEDPGGELFDHDGSGSVSRVAPASPRASKPPSGVMSSSATAVCSAAGQSVTVRPRSRLMKDARFWPAIRIRPSGVRTAVCSSTRRRFWTTLQSSPLSVER